MKISLRNKLILSYIALASFTGLIIFLLIFLTSDQRLKTLVDKEEQAEIIAEVVNWYENEGSWQGFKAYYNNLHPISADQGPGPRPKKSKKHKPNQGENQNSDSKPPKPPHPKVFGQSKGKPSKRINQHGILDKDKRVLIQFLTFKEGDIAPDAYLSKIVPISLDDKIIAWLVPRDGKGISLRAEKKVFFEHTNQVLLMAIIIALIVAACLGVFLARYLLKPIEALTKASQAMAKGELKQSIVKTSQDELGDLAESFNQMSAGLTKSDTQRRQMTADIAHDLGTPLQVISGYIEMAQELNKPLDQQKLNIISTEISHIKRLLNDLNILAKADDQSLSVQCQPVEIGALFERIQCAYRPQCELANVTFVSQLETNLAKVLLDEERMVQVLGNLINNAMRYTLEGGEISLMAWQEEEQLVIQVKDDGVGIDAEHLPFIFDRFYRVSESRSNESGNMGLGLSISKALVELQEGKISVSSDGKGEGCCFTLRFPYSSEP